MQSGKLDEELRRMRCDRRRDRPGLPAPLQRVVRGDERARGVQIARQVVRALVERGIRVFFVTHLYDLAHGFSVDPPAPALFLRAERASGGERSFKLVEGEPLPTSYGEDAYRRVFGTELGPRVSLTRGSD